MSGDCRMKFAIVAAPTFVCIGENCINTTEPAEMILIAKVVKNIIFQTHHTAPLDVVCILRYLIKKSTCMCTA